VWSLSGSEVVAAHDAHEDKIYALVVSEAGDSTIIVSGAADGTLKVMEDYTKEQVALIRREREATLVGEQRLSNCLREGKFYDAFRLALALRRQRDLKRVMERWTSVAPMGCCEQITEALASLEESDLLALLTMVREWITNARTAALSSTIVNCFIRALPFQTIVAHDQFHSVLDTLMSYSLRHSSRTHRILSRLHYVEFLLRGGRTPLLSRKPPYGEEPIAKKHRTDSSAVTN
jgi:WD40 repeat protein